MVCQERSAAMQMQVLQHLFHAPQGKYQHIEPGRMVLQRGAREADDGGHRPRHNRQSFTMRRFTGRASSDKPRK